MSFAPANVHAAASALMFAINKVNVDASCHRNTLAFLSFHSSQITRRLLPAFREPVCHRYKKRGRGVNGPHRFSLRGSDYDFTRPRKNSRTLAHAREGQALRRAQRGDFFTPRTENLLHTGIELRPRGCHQRPSTNRASDLRQTTKLEALHKLIMQ